MWRNGTPLDSRVVLLIRKRNTKLQLVSVNERIRSYTDLLPSVFGIEQRHDGEATFDFQSGITAQ